MKSPTYQPRSVEESIQWAKETVPVTLAFELEMLHDSDTWDYGGMSNWPLRMQLAVEHPKFMAWLSLFARNTQGRDRTVSLTNGAKLLALAAISLACDDNGDPVIPPRYS